MGIRFSKSIKIGKLLRINISNRGISATVGKKGASVNIGNRGTYLNLSPSAVGIDGTGLSYRKKLSGNKKKSSSVSKTKHVYQAAEETVKEEDSSIILEYEKDREAKIYMYRYADDVMNAEEFASYVEKMESVSAREMYESSARGDEDTIENLVSTFMNNLKMAYECRANYELEEDILYVDLDLPEIEDLEEEYPSLNNGKIVHKRKTTAQLKKEYSDTVLSISIFLSANFFNLSSYIQEIVISGFNTIRNSKGDLTDQYLYSVKYLRKIFEDTSLAEIEDPYSFILQFENRINLSVNHSFKPIVPYEMASVVGKDAFIEDAVLGLKQLGYKKAEIDPILVELRDGTYESASACLKEALKLLNNRKEG